MGWEKKYKVVGIVPGPIITPWVEKLDLSDPNIPVAKIDRLFEAGCPYIQKIEKKQTVAQKPTSSDNSSDKKKKS